MGQLIDGVWHDTGMTPNLPGNFSVQRRLSATGLPLTARPDLPAKADSPQKRSLPSVRFPCLPWAHRTLIFRKLKGLEPFIPVSVVNPLMLENGWTFDDTFPAATGDTSISMNFSTSCICTPIHTTAAASPYRSYGIKNHTIVSNESAEIIRMFNSAFDGLGAKAGITIPRAAKQN